MMSNHLSMAKKRNHHPICHFECVDVSLVPGISTHKNPPSLFFFDAASHVTQIFGEVAVSHGNTMQKRCGREQSNGDSCVFFLNLWSIFKGIKMIVLIAKIFLDILPLVEHKIRSVVLFHVISLGWFFSLRHIHPALPRD